MTAQSESSNKSVPEIEVAYDAVVSATGGVRAPQRMELPPPREPRAVERDETGDFWDAWFEG